MFTKSLPLSTTARGHHPRAYRLAAELSEIGRLAAGGAAAALVILALTR